MSNAKEKKYARRMRNQPSNVSFDQGDRTPQGYGRGCFPQQRGGTSGQQQRGPHHSQGPHTGGGRGRGDFNEGPQIPKYITASMFAQARAAEINAMVKAVSQKSSNSLVFQSLPRHMRRRSMGHDIKRLPRRLREIAKREMEKTVHQKKEQSKSKCRKARRRHGNLQLEFNRRQRKNMWLETHIWFTKRFHMVKKWGYCLAERPTMKSYRACYRAMSNHCLLQDLSYLCCVEVTGKEEELLKALSRLCSIETGPTFAAVPCLSGRRQGSLVLYKADKYPDEALGPVDFIWKPKSTPESCGLRQLWVWMHPALKQDILKELRLVCVCEDRPDNAVYTPALPADPPQEEKPATVKKAGKKRKMQDKEGEKAVPVKKIIGDGTRDCPDPYQWTSTQTSITIRDLTMEIVRYRLVGPLSNCVLNDALHPAPVHKKTEDRGPHSWWEDYSQNSDNNLLHDQQSSLFHLLQGITSPAQIPPGTVLGLTVGDPRVNLPKKRTKSVPNLQQYEADGEKVRSLMVNGVPVECSQSLIWSSDIRSQVTDNKITEQEVNRLRSELLVPGSQLDLGNKESKIPILLIQHPGKAKGRDQLGWGSGWDICLPKGWGMAFWIPLIYRGVRVGGLQQALQHFQYMGSPHVPGDFPDSLAGAQSALEKEAQLLEKFTKRPPAKRTNFIKNGILAPFLCPWEQLTREWEMRAGAELDRSVQEEEESGTGAELDGSVQEEEESETGAELNGSVQDEDHGTEAGAELDGSVQEEDQGSEERLHHPKEINLESGSIVGTEQNLGEEVGPKEAQGFSVLRNKKVLKMLSAWFDPYARNTSHTSSPELSSLVNPILRDSPRALVWVRLAMVTKGSPELHSLICIPAQEDFVQLRKDKLFAGPQEPKHSDPFKNKIVKQKKERKRQKSMSKHDGSEKMEINTDLAVSDQLTLGLWPSPIPKVTTHCNRLLFGFVTHGDFSMAAGCGGALGFVSLTGLLHLLQQTSDKIGIVLLRNPSSLQYRFAKLIIDA
ncbi:ribonucleases P/MRP protein subunit POP1 isoform X2 [Rana temporaria]|uniref:ribonucleases P/MRP protein subunit POP1 isoform X2 n=1 Tax=Rana temporaria TaxID=8407 RepID=UPI001AACC144|nr:ribonucleases P/MRP protein subunit POP1 isoform X2 [Rana temporaria]